MSIKLHLALMVASEFLGFLFGFAVVATLWMSGLLGSQLWLVAAIGLPVFLISTIIPRFAFRWIPARCTQADCFGKTYVQDTKPYSYECHECGHKHQTNVADSDGGIHNRF